jgi:putative acetyltransferase
MSALRIVRVDGGDAAHVATARALFQEHAEGIAVDLCFQGFAAELERLPGDYSAPDGVLLVAFEADRAAACVGLRRFDATRGEVKRLYVRPDYRGRGLARRLMDEVFAAARAARYASLLLDTLDFMSEAQTLYRALGFRERARYYENPLAGVRYYERALA